MDRLFFADFLRVIATLGVITIHVSGALHQNEALYQPQSWWISNIWICFTTWSVPMFVMLSGMLHLKADKQYSTISFIKKSLIRILAPLFFWSFLYEVFYQINIQKTSLRSINFFSLMKHVYQGESTYHLWFLYLIIGLYLITPILRVYIKQSEKKEIRYFIYVWLIASTVNMIDSLFELKNGFYLQYVSGYIGYYISGYYLSTIKFKENIRNKLLIIGFTSMAILTILSYILKTSNHQNWYSLCNNLSLFTIVNCTIIFIYFKELDWSYYLDNKFGFLVKKSVEDFSKNSFGIYLIHIFVLGIIGSKKFFFKLNANFINTAIGIPITIIFAAVISHIIVNRLRKLKFLKIIIP